MGTIEHIREGLEIAVGIIELFAVLVIVSGFIRASVAYTLTRRATDREKAFVAFRSRLGMNMLLGLEILVISDVIESITVEPSYMSLTVLAFLVALRTIVSWTTSLQLEGRWPWQPDTGGDKTDA
ncbi:MAG: DUF1622 domain-containing protein [Betaproteobacteria bacterium]|nr:MAG: DUF1622 domain-containing protein [Betaproteobacteria bacterium]